MCAPPNRAACLPPGDTLGEEQLLAGARSPATVLVAPPPPSPPPFVLIGHAASFTPY